MPESYGQPFRWFAWRPVWTDDRGWRWLRVVWRRRFFLNLDGQPAMSWFVHSVDMSTSPGHPTSPEAAS